MRLFRRKEIVLALLGSLLIAGAVYLVLISILGRTSIVVATGEIARGELLSKENVALKKVANPEVGKEDIQDLELVLGKTVKVDRVAGDHISQELLGEPEDQSLQQLLEPGEVLGSLSLPASEGIGWVIKEGDLLTVVSTDPATISVVAEAPEPKAQPERPGSEPQSTESNEPGQEERESTALDKISLANQMIIANIEVLEVVRPEHPDSRDLLEGSPQLVQIFFRATPEEASKIAFLEAKGSFKVVVQEGSL
ncbi:SAF domain-containing protein [Candidatus Hakubella thermalkaliphila]|uniref:SAF domain-containing protein n=1 Tax=Candidatus Hakubella thermalkaliphila TaxID=2754717 RepID=A0A6V8NZJ2_9ACTN|nr:SAF domain-containing protein [Candidatus Hakubella thermalkaliphila]GFP25689.1 hypothetical protein HKBW3S25_01170 [Candidatus Hakubella thermalkaliphila]GFP26812.1 hypothetical protein HKBW3S33_00226 [Candidatus Hakubella thermalkaliphila]GFP42069.1 hypothetical protein HKBW3C_01195 [Candidatus Hakubella thermalkaliphila]